jgi:hypothetical protein
MNRLRVVPVFTALIVVAALGSSAAAGSTVHVHLGADLPTGDFASTDPGQGGAELGYAITAEWLVPLGQSGLMWTTLGGVQRNGFDEGAVVTSDSALVALRTNFGDDELPGFTVKKGGWWTVPLLTGARYQIQSSENLGFFVSGHVGAAATSSPTLKWTYVNKVARVAEEEFEWDVSLAFAVGAGIYLNDRFTLSGRAYFLGTPDLQAKREFFATASQGNNRVGDVIWEDTNDWDVAVSMITVQLGVRFD